MANAIISANAPELNVINGLPVVSSLTLADHFEKQHFQVMRDIRDLSKDIPEDLRDSNFVCSQYEGKTPTGGTRSYPMYLLTRDGFTLVAMGFTGKKALAWKVKYIQAFNAMERALLEGKHGEPVILPSGDTLSPAEQAHLHAIVSAKAGMLPADIQRKVRSEIWTRFNRHFRIARYAQLAPAKMGEAVEYLVGMEVKAQKALPTHAEQAAASALAAYNSLPLPELFDDGISDKEQDKRLKRVLRDLHAMQEKCGGLIDEIRICLSPKGRKIFLPADLDNTYKTLQHLNFSATAGVYMTRQALISAYHIGRGVEFC